MIYDISCRNDTLASVSCQSINVSGQRSRSHHVLVLVFVLALALALALALVLVLVRKPPGGKTTNNQRTRDVYS